MKQRLASRSLMEGIVLVPEDRKRDGLCVNLSVEDNLALANMDLLCVGGVRNEKKKKALVDAAIHNLKVKLAGSDVDAGTLSGGNQQKVVIGKWLARQACMRAFSVDLPIWLLFSMLSQIRTVNFANKVLLYEPQISYT